MELFDHVDTVKLLKYSYVSAFTNMKMIPLLDNDENYNDYIIEVCKKYGVDKTIQYLGDSIDILEIDQNDIQIFKTICGETTMDINVYIPILVNYSYSRLIVPHLDKVPLLPGNLRSALSFVGNNGIADSHLKKYDNIFETTVDLLLSGINPGLYIYLNERLLPDNFCKLVKLSKFTISRLYYNYQPAAINLSIDICFIALVAYHHKIINNILEWSPHLIANISNGKIYMREQIFEEFINLFSKNLLYSFDDGTEDFIYWHDTHVKILSKMLSKISLSINYIVNAYM